MTLLQKLVHRAAAVAVGGLVYALGCSPLTQSKAKSSDKPYSQENSMPRQFANWMDNYKRTHPELIDAYYANTSKSYIESGKLEITIYPASNSESSVHVVNPNVWYWAGLYNGKIVFEIRDYWPKSLDAEKRGSLVPDDAVWVSDKFFDDDLDGKADRYEKEREERFPQFTTLSKKTISKNKEGTRLQSMFDNHFRKFLDTLTTKIK